MTGLGRDAELEQFVLGVEHVGEDPLGDQYSAAYTAEERRGTGATLTPMPIVSAMVEWATRQTTSLGMPERVVDCRAGTGRFAIAAARVFAKTHVIAVENDPTMALLLRANVRAAGLKAQIELIEADFRTVSLTPTNGPTLFIGNPPYVRHHRIGDEWKRWTGLPFVFAVWAALRVSSPAAVQRGHKALLASRAWGLAHLDDLAAEASNKTGVPVATCREYLGGLDYAFSDQHRTALTDFLRRAGTPQFVQVA